MLCDHQIQQCETQKVFQVDRNKFWMKTYNKKAMNGTVETTHTHTHTQEKLVYALIIVIDEQVNSQCVQMLRMYVAHISFVIVKQQQLQYNDENDHHRIARRNIL